MAKFHSLKVIDIRKETTDCVSIAFEVPDHLKNDYQYTQGQYVTLKLNIGGEEIRRSYSLCSSPVSDTELRIAAKKVTTGKGSGYLNDTLKVGDLLEVMTPMGNFHTKLDASNSKNYILFAGGSGITPMLSIIKSVLKAEPQSSLLLLYGNLNEDAIIFKNELEQLSQNNPNRLNVIHILDKPVITIDVLHTGIMTTDKVKALIEKYVDVSKPNEFFICGPTPMMKNTEDTLLTLNIPKQNIHLEYFTASLDAAKENIQPSGENRIVSQITVILDGNETSFELASDGQTILDAAMNADVDVPFSCKGAVCCTCRAKLVEGQVSMKANYALTEEEVEEGFILTCQSHPLTPTVIVDYDV